MSVHPRGMRNRTRLGLAAVLSATALAVACGDDANNNNTTPPAGGSAGTAAGSGGMAGTPTTGGTGAGTAGTFSPGGGGMGTGGTTAGTGGTGGTTAGTAGGGMAGMGGNPPVIVPTQFLIDNVRLAPKGSFGAGGDGAGGAGFGGAGGDGAAPIEVLAGAAGMDAGGQGGGPTGPLPDFLLTFDTDLQGLAKNPNGFSPGPGGSAGPATFADGTSVLWAAAVGHPGGAAKFSIPFSKSPLPPSADAFSQQADFSVSFAQAVDLTGYELTADVKMTDTGDAGDCPTAWMYVYGGNGYANDKSGEPAMGKTSHLVKGQWTKIKLDLDGPYGYHSTANHAFKPLLVQLWGIQFNTWGCAP
jgi:hypothetical protein